MEPPVANCFREISEFDDAAKRSFANGSSGGEDVNAWRLFHHQYRPVAGPPQMNIKDTFDCLVPFFCLVSLHFNGLCCIAFVIYSMLGKRVELM